MQQIYRQMKKDIENNIYSYDKAFIMTQSLSVYECVIWPKEQAIDYLSKQPDWEIHKPIEEEYSDLIVPKSGAGRIKEYNPLEVENLYLTFLDLDCSNKSILDFVNNYGYLANWFVSISKPSEIKRIIDSIIHDYHIFSVKQIKAEIKKLQQYKIWYEAIINDDLATLKLFKQERLKAFEYYINNTDLDEDQRKRILNSLREYSNKTHIKEWSKESFANDINSFGHFDDNYTSLVPTENGFKTQSFCENLLAVIYLQFAWHVAGEKEFRRCKNDKCNILFDAPASSRQAFHSKSCKNTFNSRKSQAKAKLRKSKIGGKNGKHSKTSK